MSFTRFSCTVDFCNLFFFLCVIRINNRWNWVQYWRAHRKQSLASWSFPFWGDVIAWSPSIIYGIMSTSQSSWWQDSGPMLMICHEYGMLGGGGGGECRPLSCISQPWGVMRGSCICGIEAGWLKIIQIMDLE